MSDRMTEQESALYMEAGVSAMAKFFDACWVYMPDGEEGDVVAILWARDKDAVRDAIQHAAEHYGLLDPSDK